MNPLIMPVDEFLPLPTGYSYKTINWAHMKEYESKGWEQYGHTDGMQFIVMRIKE